MSDLCCHIDYEVGSGRVAPCDKPATVVRHRQKFCAQHDPMRPGYDAAAALTEYEIMSAEYARAQQNYAEIERRAACFDELVAALNAILPYVTGSMRVTTEPLVEQAVAALKKARRE